MNSLKSWFWPLCTAVSPACLHFKKADNWSVLPFQTHIIRCCAFPVGYTSSSSTHMCISLELFMLCCVFNTPSCKSKTARHKAVKTPFPSNPSHLGWRIYGQVLTPETEAERSLPGPSLKLSTLLLDAPSHFVRFQTCFNTSGWCHWRRRLTPIPQHLLSHLELRPGFSSFHPHGSPSPCLLFEIC